MVLKAAAAVTEQIDKGADLAAAARNILLENRLTTNGKRYTVPSQTTYPYQWFWDSCFHSISLSHFDVPAAKDELRSLISAQFDNGMIPHMIYWNPGTLHKYEWGRDGTSTITQPPMIAYAAQKIYERDHDTAFLEEIYPAMYRFHTYLATVRDPRENHLIGIINPDESGEDNSPRFDALLNLDPVQDLEENLRRRMILIERNREGNLEVGPMKKFFWAKDVPFNAIAIENMRILADIALILGKTEDANYLRERAGLIEKGMRAKMFEDGIFWSTRGENYEKIKVKTWAMFSPMFAGLYSRDEAAYVIANYFWNEHEFNTRFMIPTVSVSEPSYDPAGFWRGPVWMSVNWFVYKGLMRYGFEEEAAHILDSTRALLAQSGFREYFRPDTGEGLGAEGFTWGALILDMQDSGTGENRSLL